MKLRILIIFLLFLTNLYAINMSDLETKTNILDQSEIYFDEFNVEEIDTITEQSFVKNSLESLNYGFTQSSIWIKLKLYNDYSYQSRRLLYLDNFNIDYITLYERYNGDFLEYNDGFFRQREFNNIINPYFEILLEPLEEKTFYLRVQSKSSVLNFKLFLASQSEVQSDESLNHVIIALFLGAVIALCIYNLFIFIFTKEISYIFYVLFLLFFLLFYAIHTGIYLYVFNEIIKYFSMQVFLLMNVFLLFFIKFLLNTKKYKALNNSIYIFISINAVLLLLTNSSFYPITLIMIISLFSLLYILFISLIVLNKNHELKYSVFGLFFALAAFILLVLDILGVYNYHATIPYLFEFLLFAQLVLFSMALANKLHRTSELEEAFERNRTLTKELHHRVKNNMQFIISMYRLKLSGFIGQEALEKLKEVESTIRAISKTHELLYSKNEFDYISTKDYFEELISEIKDGFTDHKVDITLDINVDLELEDAIHCGIVLNEAITNAFKYAFKDNRGFIHIKIIEVLDKKIFIIEDNGVGFDQEEFQTSFGLIMIKSLVQDELKGNLLIESKHGTRLIIEF